MIIQNSTDIKTELFYDKNGDISPIDVEYEKHIINPNGLIQLRNIPSIHTVFTITRGAGVDLIKYTKVESLIKSQTEFMVDYANGILTFHQSQVGKEIEVSYTNAIGRLSISAERVFTKVNNKGEIIETLDTLISDGRQVLSDLTVLGGATKVITEVGGYMKSITDLTSNIIKGGTINSDLKRNITSAEISNSSLLETIGESTRKATELDNWVETHGDIVDLDSRVDKKIGIDEKVFYDEIDIQKKRDETSGTTYWLTLIPYKDKNGNIIKLKTGVSEYYETNPNRHADDGTGTNYNTNPNLETARNFSKRKKATLVINGGTWGNQGANGNCVVNGEIKASVSAQYKRMPLGIKADNTLKSYDYTVSAQEEINDGCLDVIPGFYPILVSGIKYDSGLILDWDEKQPRTIIGQKENKDIIIITADGRTTNENGLSMNDGVRLLLQHGCTFGYNLDGGGSTSLVYKNEFINNKIDDSRKSERSLYSFIYVAKEKEIDYKSKLSEELINTTVSVGELKSMIQDVAVDLINKMDFNTGYIRVKGEKGYEYQGVESWDGENRNTKLILHKDYLRYYDYINSRGMFYVGKEGEITTPRGTLGIFNNSVSTTLDLNAISESGLYWATKDSIGVPYQISCGILHFQIGSTGKMQIAFPYTTDNSTYKIKIRRSDVGGSYLEWKDF